MKTPFQVLVAGRAQHDIDPLVTQIKTLPNVTVQTRTISGDDHDPLHGLKVQPELLIMPLSAAWQTELQALAARPPALRPPMIVIGPAHGTASDTEIMRKAMQAGSRDFFSRPIPEPELAESIRRLYQDRQDAALQGDARFTAVINAKGGSGASSIACNLAHLLSVRWHTKTALVDLDIQFGALSLNLDLKPEYSLKDVFNAGDGLDAMALEGFMAKHSSGLHLIGPPAKELMLPDEVPRPALQQTLTLLNSGYSHVVIDLPRQIDSITSLVLERADHILIVIQQGLSHLRDTGRLLEVLISDLGINRNKIKVVVNRHDPKRMIGLEDIKKALQHEALETLPNDFRRVAESVNLGIPLHDYAPKAAITRDLDDLVAKLLGHPPAKRSLFNRLGL